MLKERIILFFVFAILSIKSLSADSLKKLIIIHSYPSGEWTHEINEGVEESLKKEAISLEIKSIIYHSEYWRLKDPPAQKLEQERIIKESKEYNPDIILLCDDEATDLLATRLIDLKKPIFVTGINKNPNQLTWLNKDNKNRFSGIFETYQIEKGNELLKQFNSKIKTVSVLTSNNITSQILSSSFKKEFNKDGKYFSSGFKLRKIYNLSFWSQWQDAVREINKLDDAVWVLVPYDIKDQNNQELSLVEVGKWLNKNLKKPSIGILSIHTKIGLLASVNTHPRGLGAQVGDMISRYLKKGDSSEKIGFEKSKYYKIQINKKAMNRLALTFPKNSSLKVEFLQSQSLKYGR